MDRISRLKQLLEQSPDDSFLKHALALEYIKQQQEDKAEKLFTEVLSTDPQYVGSYYQLGKLLERKGDIREAAGIYHKGMEIAGQMHETHAYNELQAAYEEIADE
jgi:Tfp pilus assembly protein PilF